MKKYKLTDRDGYTRRGEPGETYWLDGKEKIATGVGNELCTDDVIHYYDHPLLAVLSNPIHARIVYPRLIEIDIDKEWAHDGLKGGCKKARYIKEIAVPKITPEQMVAFGIKIVIKFYKDTVYKKWAKNWLNGNDRTRASAEIAADSARRAADSARYVADVVVLSEWSARRAALRADSARRVADIARRVADIAELSAACGADIAALSEWNAAEINKLFTKTIMEIRR